MAIVASLQVHRVPHTWCPGTSQQCCYAVLILACSLWHNTMLGFKCWVHALTQIHARFFNRSEARPASREGMGSTERAWHFCTIANKYIYLQHRAMKLKSMSQTVRNGFSDLPLCIIPENYRKSCESTEFLAQVLWVSYLPHIPQPKQKKGWKRG